MRRKLAALLAAVLLAGVLCACAGGDRQEEGLRLWFASALTNENGWTGAAQAVSTVAYTGEENVGSLLAALLAGPPEASGLISPFPAGTELLGWKRSGSIVQVTLSTAYGTLSGVEQTVADYCIALTLTQLAGVDGVRIAAEDSDRSRRILRLSAVWHIDDHGLNPAELPRVDRKGLLQRRNVIAAAEQIVQLFIQNRIGSGNQDRLLHGRFLLGNRNACARTCFSDANKQLSILLYII